MSNAIALFPIYKNGSMITPRYNEVGPSPTFKNYAQGFMCGRISNIKLFNKIPVLTTTYSFDNDLTDGDSIDIIINSSTTNVPFNTDMGTTMGDCLTVFANAVNDDSLNVVDADGNTSNSFQIKQSLQGASITLVINSVSPVNLTVTNERNDNGSGYSFDYLSSNINVDQYIVFVRSGLDLSSINDPIAGGFNVAAISDYHGQGGFTIPIGSICDMKLVTNDSYGYFHTAVSYIGADKITLLSTVCGDDNTPYSLVNSMNPSL